MSSNRSKGNDAKYLTVIRQESLTDGRPWFVAFHPQLPGCVADGPTREIAMQELNEVREDFIASLVEDGLPVPTPDPVADSRTVTVGVTSRAGALIRDHYDVKGSEDPAVSVEVEPRVSLAAD